MSKRLLIQNGLEIVWSVKSLLCGTEDLSSISRIHIKIGGLVACACDPSTGEVVISRIPRIHGIAGLVE